MKSTQSPHPQQRAVQSVPLAPPKPSSTSATVTTAPRKKPPVDHRVALFNGKKIGTAQQIQLPLTEITSLHGIMFDLDPKDFLKGPYVKLAEKGAKTLYQKLVNPWLTRHPVLSKAQVRATGTGLHVLLLLDTPVEFESSNQREQWASRVKIIQGLLPIDARQPGITATTRMIGSINSKSDQVVKYLTKGEKVTHDELISLADQVVNAPFATLAQVLFGDVRVSPCPVCRTDGSSMSAASHVGTCYSCGKINIAQLYDHFLQ